jgi:hypothetical protein
MNLLSEDCIFGCTLNFQSPGLPAARNTHKRSL